MSAPADEEDSGMEPEFTFDFTEQRDEPFELLPTAGPGHPPTILARGEDLMPIRYRRIPD